jgi:hypothetical protein
MFPGQTADIAGAEPTGAPAQIASLEGVGPPDGPPQRRMTWRGRLILIGGTVIVLLMLGGSALAHALMHATGSGMCGGG